MRRGVSARFAVFIFVSILGSGCRGNVEQSLKGTGGDTVLHFASVAEESACADPSCLPGAWRGQFTNGTKVKTGTISAPSGEFAQDDRCARDAIPFGAGRGVASDPFLICSAPQFEQISQAPSAFYRIVTDLDFGGRAPARIARFTGHLFGGGHRLSHVRWSSVPVDGSDTLGGLFDLQAGQVRDLVLENFALVGPAPLRPVRVALFAIRNRGILRNLSGTDGNRIELGRIAETRAPASEKPGEPDFLPHEHLRIGGLVAENSGLLEDIDWSVRVSVAAPAGAVGGLVGVNRGKIHEVAIRSWARAPEAEALGGIAGENRASMSDVRVALMAFADGTGIRRSTPSHFVGGQDVGALAGVNSARIADADIWASVVGNGNVGGAAGVNTGRFAELVRVRFHGMSSGGERTGGIVGLNMAGARVEAAFADVTVEALQGAVGAIAGENASGELLQSEARGMVSVKQDSPRGRSSAGGIVGRNSTLGGASFSRGGQVVGCVAAVRVYAIGDLGGVVGHHCADCRISDSHASSLPEGGPGLHCYVGARAVGGVAGYSEGEIRGAYARTTLSDIARTASRCSSFGRVIGEGDASRVKDSASRAPASRFR